MTIPDLSAFTTAQVIELRDEIYAYQLAKAKGETLQSGSKNGKSYSVDTMTPAEITGYLSAIAQRLGKRTTQRRRIDFNNRRAW